MTSWRGRALLAFGGLALALGVSELVLRQLVPTTSHDDWVQTSSDPELGFELRPGADLEFDGVTIKIPATHVRVSSQGARGPELALQKPPGVRRLVCIGDSVAFGWGVGENQTQCAVLAATLGPKWEVVNLAVPGYGAAQKRRQLELRGLAFQPDVVLVQFDQNDRDPPDPQAGSDSIWAWLVDRSAVFRFVHIQLFLNGGDGPEAPPTFDGEAEVVREFSRMGAICAEADVPVVVTLRATDSDSAFIGALRERGIPVVDVGPALRGGDPAALEIPGDGHPTAEGHRRAAAAALAAVKQAAQ